MTADEFKAWFAGFCEAVGASPTPEQWIKIIDQVGRIQTVKFSGYRNTPFRTWYGYDTPQNEGQSAASPLPNRGVVISDYGMLPDTRVPGPGGRDLGSVD